MVASCKTPTTMAALMAGHDIVVMPSNSQYWHETFGIVSIEAQHLGCRVVASDDGGLPEQPTAEGGAGQAGQRRSPRLGHHQRRRLRSGFSGRPPSRWHQVHRRAVVDSLLDVFARPLPIPPAVIVRQLEELISAPSAQVTRTPNPGGALAGTAP